VSIDVLTGMRVFATVVDAGSFAGAADKLELSRGMTSRYVKQIESHLGVRLLNRTTRRQSLTEAGQDYYQRATQVLAMVEEAEQSAAQGSAEPRGTLRVNGSVAFGARHLGPAIGVWLKRHRQVKVDLTLNDRVVDLVEEGFDVAVRIGQPQYHGGLAEVVRNPRYATAVGLVLLGLQQQRQHELAQAQIGSLQGMFEHMKSWFKGNF